MTKAPKSQRLRSRTGKPSRPGEVGKVDRAAGAVKSPEEAMLLKLELDALIRDIQYTEKTSNREYFDWLGANVPELSKIKGRPHWSASEKVKRQDEALLKSFEQTLNQNVAANAGRKHGASQKTYSDLADKSGDDDDATTKQRVMRARRRRKALQETIQDILGIAALGRTDGDKLITPKEYKKRREKLLDAFRRILRTKSQTADAAETASTERRTNSTLRSQSGVAVAQTRPPTSGGRSRP